jgi:ParB-like nuclease domain
MTNITILKGVREAPKSARSAMETLLLTQDEVEHWLTPPFQRPLRINDKVRAMADGMLKDGGVISGVLTLGLLSGVKHYYIVDGQHRIEAFKISGLKEAIADVRIVNFEMMSDMAEEFVNLNSQLVTMRPDDILRGLEGSVPALQAIKSRCEFVGYGQIRRDSTTSSVLSMSVALRTWTMSKQESPSSAGGISAAQLARDMDRDGASNLIDFLLTARAAWGRDSEYYRLWSNLNLTVCMWLWRRLVMDKTRGVRRYVVLDRDQFKRCLVALSADGDYIDWLRGRNLGERDRSPCYIRMKAIFVKRLQEDKPSNRILLPQPEWSSR